MPLSPASLKPPTTQASCLKPNQRKEPSLDGGNPILNCSFCRQRTLQTAARATFAGKNPDVQTPHHACRRSLCLPKRISTSRAPVSHTPCRTSSPEDPPEFLALPQKAIRCRWQIRASR